MNLNQCIFIGRLVADPKIKEDADPEKTRCFFRLAVNRQFKKGKADYPQFAAWGKLAQAIMEHCKKGKELTVISEYQTEWYPPEREGGEGVNFRIFRANRVIFGIDSQEVLKEKEVARQAEMRRVVSIEVSGTDKEVESWGEAVVESEEAIDRVLTQLAKERYETGG